jgi:hypothetical protein
MSDDLISSFVQQQVDGMTLSMIANSDELTIHFLVNVNINPAKIKVLWAFIKTWSDENYKFD